MIKTKKYCVHTYQIKRRGNNTTLIPIVKIGLSESEAEEAADYYRKDSTYCNISIKNQ
jgi:hypothetical protein